MAVYSPSGSGGVGGYEIKPKGVVHLHMEARPSEIRYVPVKPPEWPMRA